MHGRMTVSADPYDVPPDPLGTLARVAVRAESIVCVVFGWSIALIALVVPLGIAACPFVAAGDPGRRSMTPYLGLLLGGTLLIVHGSYFTTTLRALRRPGPLGVGAALLSPHWRGPVRAVAVVWWTVLFVAGSCFAMFLETSSYLSTGDDYGTPAALHNGTAAGWVAVIVGTFGLTMAGNTFLLLAVATVTRNERVLARVWSLRAPIDAVVILIPAVMAYCGVWH